MIAPLWLAHHRGEGLARCWNIRGVRICARCSGLFPALLLTMGAEALWPSSLPLRVSLALEVLLLVPGLWDVLREVASPRTAAGPSSNGIRFASGAGLGIALGHAAMVGDTRGWTTPEALLPIGAASVQPFGFWTCIGPSGAAQSWNPTRPVDGWAARSRPSKVEVDEPTLPRTLASPQALARPLWAGDDRVFARDLAGRGALFAGPFVKVPNPAGGGNTTVFALLMQAYQIYNNSYFFALCAPMP